MGLNALIISLGYLVFYSTGLLFDSSSNLSSACLRCSAAYLVSSAMIEIDRQTHLIEADRQRMREAQAQATSELAAARRFSSVPC